MKISILFITYNHSRFVAEAIRSVIDQDYPDIELVVCDDGSTDCTVEVIEKELADCPSHISVIRFYSEQNHGLLKNFNRGFAACSGEIIVVMSGDDISSPSRVSRVSKEFAADPECMLVCSNFLRIDDGGRALGVKKKYSRDTVYSHAHGLKHVYAHAPVCGATAAYRITLRELFPPMQTGRHAEDNCFWFRALLVGNIHYLGDPLVSWRTHGNNQFNWTPDNVDAEDARIRHLRFLRTHQCMRHQWTRDLGHAVNTGLITHDMQDRLLRLARLNQEYYRLKRFSITPMPWKLWLASASRILRLNDSLLMMRKSLSRISRNHLPLRLSARRRNAYLQNYFRTET